MLRQEFHLPFGFPRPDGVVGQHVRAGQEQQFIRLARFQQRVCERTADLSCDSRDDIHDPAPFS